MKVTSLPRTTLLNEPSSCRSKSSGSDEANFRHQRVRQEVRVQTDVRLVKNDFTAADFGPTYANDISCQLDLFEIKQIGYRHID